MITLETVVAFALRDRTVMDALGEALRSDVVVANPFLRQLNVYADDFLSRYGKLPLSGDWEVWMESLPEAQAAGCRETLGRLQSIDTSGYQPEHFAELVMPELRKAAAKTAMARLNSMTEPDPEALAKLSEEVASISARSISGLANLADINVWSSPDREEDFIPTGFHRLDRTIGGFGKELWIILADAKAGKSMLLQNLTANIARRGARCLHISLELGLRQQILRYYRQIAQAHRGEFVTKPADVRQRLSHWFRLSAGGIYLLEYPAYSIDTDELHRVVQRVERQVGKIDLLTLDYLDLVLAPKGKKVGQRYADLGVVTHSVRALCPAFDIPVLSATQAVRNLQKKGHVTAKDMGDSYEKIRGSDGVLSLIQTEEEQEVHQGRLGIVVSRESQGGGVEFPVYINRDLALIQELDTPNTRELMRRLGHLPA